MERVRNGKSHHIILFGRGKNELARRLYLTSYKVHNPRRLPQRLEINGCIDLVVMARKVSSVLSSCLKIRVHYTLSRRNCEACESDPVIGGKTRCRSVIALS